MAYDQFQAERIEQRLNKKKINFETKKMMGGYCVMVDDKMCLGLLQDKQTKEDLLMVRIGEEAYHKVKEDKHVLPMDFTGRPMKGYAFIKAEGFDLESALDKWIDLCLDFNPLAKSSKKKKK